MNNLFYYENFDDCQNEVIDSVKLMLYQRHNDIFERLDFDNDEIYEEPLLFAYLVQNNDEWLDSVIYGYEKNKKSKISVFSNNKGIVYLPRVGYFKTNQLNAELFLLNTNNEYQIIDELNNPVSYQFEPIFLLNEDIELVKTQHPLLQNLFLDSEDKPTEVEIDEVYTQHISHFNNALEIIKKYYNDYFQLLKKNIKKVLIYDGVPNSFAAIQAHNMIFLNAHKENDEVFFLDHILHEGAHVIFNTLTYNTKTELFTIPFNSQLSEATKNPEDRGELFGRFHGLFTQSHIDPCMEICIEKNIFEGKQHHELLGRFSSNLKRFAIGVKTFDLPELYKEEGLKWYSFAKNRFEELTSRNEKLINSYEVSNQPYVFSYEVFKESNPL